MRIELLDEAIASELTKAFLAIDRFTGQSQLSTTIRQALNDQGNTLNTIVATSIQALLSDPEFLTNLKNSIGDAITTTVCTRVNAAIKSIPRAAVLPFVTQETPKERLE